ncbi:MAG: Multicopper oxidase [Acidobacteriaceae bacterium]|nr:Multicopper oxidase [Acidobacteriaceae bacterium]
MGVHKYLIIALLTSGPVLLAQTKAQDRLLQTLDSGESVVIRGSAHPRAQAQFDQGLLNGNTVLPGVTLVFKPSPAQQAALEKLLTEQQRPSSPLYHKWLTPEQYADRFGLTNNDVGKVTTWLESQGFTVDRVGRGRTQLSFTGSVARINAVFKTEIHNYVVSDETHFANSTELSIPTALSDVVLTVRNLDDFRPRARVRRVSPHFTSNVTGNHFLAPADFATIYDVKRLYDLGLDGTRQKIVVVGDSTVTMSNIARFRSLAGLPANNPTEILVSGTGTGVLPSSGEQTEAYLDIEWSGAIAKNATIYYVYVGNNANSSVWDAISYAVDNVTAPVISTSFGYCEVGNGKAFDLTVQQWAQRANSQGQTIVAAAGDAGAADCDSGATATQGYAVDVPAAIPEVTGIGGSEFTGDPASTSTTTYWDATNSNANASAISYIPEEVWNDTATDGTLSAGGGGKSVYFSKPTWQIGTGVPGDGQRDVPDISLNGSADHDPYLICDGIDSAGNQSCTNGFRNSQGNLDAVGGTSMGAPTFAGILALINQATSKSGQGNVNSILYSLAASTPGAFHDITTGNNMVPCKPGTMNCPASTPYQFGYSAGAGYDLASGLGSIDTYNLVTSWPNYAGSYSLTDTPATVAAAGSSGTSTITATGASGFTGTVALACASTNATIGCSLSPTSVTLSNSAITASSTLTITTTGAKVIPGKSSAARPFGRHNWFGTAGGSMIAAFFLAGIPKRKRRWASLLGMLVFGSLLTAIGCGGSNSSTATSSSSSGTPAGTYFVTVTGTSGTLTQTSSVTVTVN